jgi:hypothetical protein
MIVRLAFSASVGLTILSAGIPSQAQSVPEQLSVQMPTAEWSASKKNRRYLRAPSRPSYAYRVPSYGRLGDPSLGPNGLPYRRPYDPGGCIIDEGYGRFTSCSNR